MAVRPAGGESVGESVVAGTLVSVDGGAGGGGELVFFPQAATDADVAQLPHSLHWRLPAAARAGGGSAGGASAAAVLAPMPGKVVKVSAAAGDAVAEGAPLLVLEAMKMEHVIKAPRAGTLAAVAYKVGDFVEDRAELVRFVAPAPAAK
jgi:3-methylcrotonyl-CoA carboxylase alpha subunit